MDTEMTCSEAVSSCLLCVAGMSVCLETNDPQLADELLDVFGGPMKPATPESEFVTLAIRVAGRGRIGSYANPFFRGRAHVVTARFGDDVFVFDLLRRSAMAVVSESTARDLAAWRSIFLPIAAGVLGPSIGIVPFHCASVVTPFGAALLAGISGAGKSTLAVAAAREGCGLVADDWTYIQVKDSRPLAHGVPGTVKLLPDADHFFPELQNRQPAPALNGELAYEIDAALVGATVVPNCVPDRLFFVERVAEGKCQFLPLSSEAVMSYFQNTCERLPGELAQIAAMRSDVMQHVAALPAFRFCYSGDPRQGARGLLEFPHRLERRAA